MSGWQFIFCFFLTSINAKFVKETEDAVQSIALFDDNASRHSGEEGSAAMDINYMSDATSRRSSIADTATVLAQDSQDVQKEFTNGTTEDQVQRWVKMLMLSAHAFELSFASKLICRGGENRHFEKLKNLR